MSNAARKHEHQSDSSSAPAHTIKLGSIQASIWEKETKHGTQYQVNLTRVYKSGEDWKRTSYLSKNELPIAEKALARAFFWIQGAEEKEG